MLWPNGEFSLGLSMPVKSHKPPNPSPRRERSGKAQTTYSKRMVRNCVAQLERLHGKQNLAFTTYTLPELPAEDMAIIREQFPTVCHQLKQMIERDLQRAGLKPEVVYVIEIQEERYQKTGEAVPHIHAVFQSRKSRYHPYAISKERNTQLWNRAVSNVLDREIEIPSGARIEKVKKSAERYMAKYMSKGGAIAQKLADEGRVNELPKAWWGATLTLRRWVKANIKLFSEKSEQFIKDNYRQFTENLKESPFSWIYVHLVEVFEPHGEDIEIPVAVVGKIKRNWIDAFECKYLEVNI
jgi:hypothetical protein